MPPPALPRRSFTASTTRKTTLHKIYPGWHHCGPKKPKDACYVGHATFLRAGMLRLGLRATGSVELSDFTRTVLKLGSTFKDVQVMTAPTGSNSPQPSPTRHV